VVKLLTRVSRVGSIPLTCDFPVKTSLLERNVPVTKAESRCRHGAG
jgi:hypothetical protein